MWATKISRGRDGSPEVWRNIITIAENPMKVMPITATV
jgi:hypothetical protein